MINLGPTISYGYPKTYEKRKQFTLYCNSICNHQGLIPEIDGTVLPVISNIIVTRPLTHEELRLHNFNTFAPIANSKNPIQIKRRVNSERWLAFFYFKNLWMEFTSFRPFRPFRPYLVLEAYRAQVCLLEFHVLLLQS